MGPIGCFPSCFSSLSNKGAYLKNRIVPYTRMAPGVLLVAICVTGAISSVVLGVPYLSLVFVAGVVFSSYTVYLGFEFRNLKGHAENVERMHISLDRLEDDLALISAERDALTKNLDAVTGQLTVLNNAVDGLESVKQTLSETLATRDGELRATHVEYVALKEKLDGITKSLLESADQVKGIAGMKEVLETIAETGSENYGKLGQHVGTLSSCLGQLEGFIQTSRESQDEVKQAMGSQCEQLLVTGKMLTKILDNVQSFYSSEEMQRQIERHEKLNESYHQRIRDLNQQIGVYEGQLKQLKPQVEQLKGEREKLSKVKDQFEALYPLLKTEADRLTNAPSSPGSKETEQQVAKTVQKIMTNVLSQMQAADLELRSVRKDTPVYATT